MMRLSATFTRRVLIGDAALSLPDGAARSGASTTAIGICGEAGSVGVVSSSQLNIGVPIVQLWTCHHEMKRQFRNVN